MIGESEEWVEKSGVFADAIDWYTDGNDVSPPPTSFLALSFGDQERTMVVLFKMDLIFGHEGMRALSPVIRTGDKEAMAAAMQGAPVRPGLVDDLAAIQQRRQAAAFN